MTSRVTLTISDNGIAHVTLNRPDKLNALDMKMFLAIKNVINTIKKNSKVRVVILSGAGEDFCSGLDIKSVMKSPTNAMKLLFKWLPGNANLAQKVSSYWNRLPVPVITAIHGRCWGGGTQIALGTDFRIAHAKADISIMEAKWGLIPDMAGNHPLFKIMPLDQAKKLAMTAQTLKADEAHKLGLITEVADKPLERAFELAEELLNTSPDVLKYLKKLYNENNHKSERTVLAKESWYQVKILFGKNQRIAVKRAQGKDKPFV